MHIFKKRLNKEKIDSSKENLSFQALLIRVIKFKTPKNPVHESGRDFYLFTSYLFTLTSNNVLNGIFGK